MKINGKTYGYRVQRSKSGYQSFEHLHFTIHNLSEYASSDASIEFQFQASPSDESWYSGKVTINADPGSYLFDESVKIVQKLMRYTPEEHGVPAYCFGQVFDSLLARIAKAGMPRCEYDSRLHRYVAEKDAKPSSHARWIDDYRRLGRVNCGVRNTIICESEEEAKRLVRADLAGYSDPSIVKDFIDAGEPVMVADFGPTWYPLEEMYALPGRKPSE